MHNNVGKFICNLRKKHNLTQQELAQKLHVTYQAVSKWENGKSIPDILMLQQISKEFNVDISEILEGKKKRKNKFIFLSMAVSLVIIISLFFLIKRDNAFEFKTIVADNDIFSIDGVAAYSKDKSSIYISSINMLEESNDTYELVSCTLFENKNNKKIEVSSCEESKKNTTLAELLKNINFYIDDINCNNLKDHDLYIEVNATSSDGQTHRYKIPLKFNDYCE